MNVDSVTRARIVALEAEVARCRDALTKASMTNGLQAAQVRRVHSMLDGAGIERRPPGSHYSMVWRVAAMIRLHGLYRAAWECEE